MTVQLTASVMARIVLYKDKRGVLCFLGHNNKNMVLENDCI